MIVLSCIRPGREAFEHGGHGLAIEAAAVIEPTLGVDPFGPCLTALREVADRPRERFELGGADVDRPATDELRELADRLEPGLADRALGARAIPSRAAQPDPAGRALEIGHVALPFECKVR
jgi:hypothetical protein